jgi:alanyl-tRNA synthetase
MRSSEIRQSFVDFFRERGHRPVASSPLVPHGDATLLFTNAGMVQFKDYFTGAARPEFPRAVTVQKCLRVSGKHNDLENVGPSPRHHTFFEMLGNFSFGDYFKPQAIEFGWDLVTRVWGLSPSHLFASVYEQDDEAAELWRKISGLPPGRIVRCGEKDNFWAMGETGPCGPCSEIYVDRRPDLPQVGWEEGTDSGRYLEIWNLVFMQYERSKDGTLTPLPKPSIDTGAGLERVAAVVAGVDSNYDTDLFQPILAGAASLAGTAYGRNAEHDTSLRVIADHLRATAFLLADGVIPTNDGRGYVLRRLLRRAVRHGMRVGFEEPFLCRLLPIVDEAMAGAYPELKATQSASAATIRAEEEKFFDTVAIGSRMVQEGIEEAKRAGRKVLSGEQVFRLYDTYGLPIQLLREIAEEERFAVDEAGFEAAIAGQRERSRAATGSSQKSKQFVEMALAKIPEAQQPTKFEGYEKLSVEGVKVVAAVASAEPPRGSSESGESMGSADLLEGVGKGESGVLVLDRTVFYAESGGEGLAIQKRITDIARSGGLRLLGPNCLGVFNPQTGFFGTFTQSLDREMPHAGPLGIVSQSGAYGSHIAYLARQRGIGINYWITTGNEADVDVSEAIEWMAGQDDVKVIMAYVEGVRNGPRFRAALERARASAALWRWRRRTASRSS